MSRRSRKARMACVARVRTMGPRSRVPAQLGERTAKARAGCRLRPPPRASPRVMATGRAAVRRCRARRAIRRRWYGCSSPPAVAPHVRRPWRSSTITVGSSCRRDALVLLDAPLRESEARHHVRDPHEALAEERCEDVLAVGLVGQREDGVGVRVVDELGREEGVQERLDAGRRGGCLEQVRAQLVHHGLIGHRLERAQPPQRLEANGGMSRGLDGRQVPARALDVEDLDRLAEGVCR